MEVLTMQQTITDITDAEIMTIWQDVLNAVTPEQYISGRTFFGLSDVEDTLSEAEDCAIQGTFDWDRTAVAITCRLAQAGFIEELCEEDLHASGRIKILWPLPGRPTFARVEAGEVGRCVEIARREKLLSIDQVAWRDTGRARLDPCDNGFEDLAIWLARAIESGWLLTEEGGLDDSWRPFERVVAVYEDPGNHPEACFYMAVTGAALNSLRDHRALSNGWQVG
jgi:hypothetical protein